MSAKIHGGMEVLWKPGGEFGVVKVVMRNGRFLVRFATRSKWFSTHEKSAFEVVA